MRPAALLLLFTNLAAAQTVTTVAGSGRRGSADGNGAQATFAAPWSITVDRQGDLYVADWGANKLRRVTPEGLVTTFFGDGQYAVGPKSTLPYSVAVDSKGDVYVVDAPDEDSPYSAGAIRRITPVGEATTVLDGFFSAVAVDGEDTLYAMDVLGGLSKLRPGGARELLAGRVAFAGALAVDASHGVVVADMPRDVLWKVSPGGEVARLAEAASFFGPWGIAVGVYGNVYVADNGNQVIRKISALGEVTTVAGSGALGDADGEGRAASFRGPGSLALDCSGNLYVADTGNYKIRRVAVAEAAAGCGAWIVPTAARVGGAHGSFWTTDLTVHNRGPEAATATLRFLGNGDDTRGLPQTTLALDANQSVTIPDVLASAFGLGEAFGALEVVSGSGALVVRSRTSSGGLEGSVGDNVPGVPRRAFFGDQTSPSPVLTGLREDEAFRSNLVLVNGVDAPVTVAVTALDGSGAVLGERSYALPPRGMLQDSRFLARPELGGAPRTGVSVRIATTTPGATFTALATVIDNVSNDPTTVLPQ